MEKKRDDNTTNGGSLANNNSFGGTRHVRAPMISNMKQTCVCMCVVNVRQAREYYGTGTVIKFRIRDQKAPFVVAITTFVVSILFVDTGGHLSFHVHSFNHSFILFGGKTNQDAPQS